MLFIIVCVNWLNIGEFVWFLIYCVSLVIFYLSKFIDLVRFYIIE